MKGFVYVPRLSEVKCKMTALIWRRKFLDRLRFGCDMFIAHLLAGFIVRTRVKSDVEN